MYIKNSILSLVFLFIGIIDFFGQCVIERNIPIIDNDTTYISILVDGIASDSLGSPGQGLCGINIDFRHEFLGDISMELFSPSGQNIRLTGAAVPVSGNTSFTRWDVLFVPCNDSPLPDPGFSSTWDNLQPWGIFGNYSGQYHPFLGCLEDFNVGSANGTWTLRISDVSQFGSGRIQGVTLFFCDDDGIQCNFCKLDPGNITAAPVEQCQNSTAIVFENYSETFPVFPKDTQNYFYHWALFLDSTYVNLLPQVSISNLQVGNYTVCNLQFAKLESDRLPDYPAAFNVKSLNQYFDDNFLCARVGENCINISIYPTSDTLILDTTLCKGDTIFFQNQNFHEEGEYILHLPGQFCDTILVLNLYLKNVGASIFAEHDTISCSNNELILQGFFSDTTIVNPEFNWFTNNGIIVPTSDPGIVRVQTKGIYFLTISDGVCSDTKSIEVFLDNNFPYVEILGEDTLTCFLDTILLTVVTDPGITSVNWYSTLDFIDEGNQIKVYQPGEYFIEIMNEDSCRSIASFEVFQIDSITPFLLSGDTLQCRKDSVFIYLHHFENGSFLYDWTGVEAGYENQKNPLTTTSGLKYVEVINTKTGCMLKDSFFIPDDRRYPDIDISVQNLTCSIDSVIPELVVDIPVAEYYWNGPGLNTTDSIVIIRNPGVFTIRVTTPEGCFSEKTFSVYLDTITAKITLTADTLACDMDSVYIEVTSDNPIVSYLWYDPAGNLFSIANRPSVKVAGLYSLRAFDENGCLSIQNIEVIASGELPNIEFNSGSLSCVTDSVKIEVNKSLGYSFFWEFPDNTTTNIAEPVVYLPGVYTVTITDNNQPECIEYKEIHISDHRQFIILEKIYGDLKCTVDSTLVQIVSDLDSITLIIQGPSFYAQDLFEFFVFETGLYTLEAISKEGCSTIDSFIISLNDIHPNISVVSAPVINCLTPESTVRFQSDIIGTQYEIFQGPDLIANGNNVNISFPGDFVVYGIAPNFCRDTTFFTILMDTIKPDVNLLPFDTITCINPTTILEAFSTFTDATVSWLPNNPAKITIDEGGIYTVRATHPQNGCKIEKSIEVFERKIYAEYVAGATKITCKNENALVEIVPGNDFENITWSDNNPVSVIPGTLSFFTHKAGIYFFEVRSIQQCNITDSVIVTSDTLPPVIDNIQSGELNCVVLQVEMSVSSSSVLDSIIWQYPDGILINGTNILTAQPGIYLVTLYGNNGCIRDTFIEIYKNLDIPVFTTFTDSLSCKKGKGFIGVQTLEDNLSYEWKGPSSFYAATASTLVTESGLYTVVVTKMNGCKDSAQIVVTGDYVVPEFEIMDTFFIPCDSSFIVLEVTDSEVIEQFYWALNGFLFSNEAAPVTNQPGDYTIIITGANGCRTSKDFLVQQVTLPIGFSFTTDTITCAQKVAVLNAYSPHSLAEYTWISPNGNLFFTNHIFTEESGIFQLIVKDDFKCLDTVEVVVAIDTISPYVEIEQSGLVMCENREIELLVKGEYQSQDFTYFWFGNSSQILSNPTLAAIRVNGDGVYRLRVNNTKNGCDEIYTYIVEEVESDFNQIPVNVQQPLCPEFNFGSFTIGNLTGTPPFNVYLNGDIYPNTFAFYLLSPGLYTLAVKDGSGCIADTVLKINNFQPVSFHLPKDTLLLLGDSLIFDLNADSVFLNNYTIHWLEKFDTICSGNCPHAITVYPKATTIYTLQLLSKDGNCRIGKSIFVNMRDEIFSGIPNSFSPNAENVLNRIFFIPQTRGIDKILSMEIYDKWANPLFARYNFDSGDPSHGWDGTYKGVFVEEGVYVVICKLKLSNGSVIVYEGDVTFFK